MTDFPDDPPPGEYRLGRTVVLVGEDTLVRVQAELAAAKRRIEELEAGLTCAMNVWGPLEPGDSRAVSNEYVAVAAILCGLGNDEGRAIIDTANASALLRDKESQ